jgi:hypothetical protein
LPTWPRNGLNVEPREIGAVLAANPVSATGLGPEPGWQGAIIVTPFTTARTRPFDTRAYGPVGPERTAPDRSVALPTCPIVCSCAGADYRPPDPGAQFCSMTPTALAAPF